MLKELNNVKVSQLKELDVRYSNQKSFYGKALVGNIGSTKVLYSYLTPVAYVKDGKQVVTDNGSLLSSATMKHIHEFLKQYGIEDLPKQQLVKNYGGII